VSSRVEEARFATTGAPQFAWGRLIFTFALTLSAIGLFAAAFAYGYARLNEGRVLPGVDVAGINLAGLDRAASERRLRAALPSLSAGNLTVQAGAVEESIRYADFNRDYDYRFMLDQAFGLGRESNPLDQLREQLAILQNGASVQPVMTWNSEKLARQVASVAEAAQVPVVDATLDRVDGRYVVSPAHVGTSIDVEEVVASAMAAVNNLSPESAQIVIPGTPVLPTVTTEVAQAAADRAEQVMSESLALAGEDLSTAIDAAVLRGWVHLDEVAPGDWKLSIEGPPITQYVASYALEADTPATNATFRVANNQIEVVPSALGRAVDVATTSANVLAALQARADGQPTATAAMALVPVEPTLSTGQAQQIAPRVKKLSEWTTRFIPGPLNGNGVNIQLPTSAIDGYVVEPGGTFDYLTAIGPITSPPYVGGGALLHGQIQEDGVIGGGMCSSSTTLFNAAVRYGLPITARINHSLYISRYPIGLDATVWMTGPRNRHTMAFTNDTGYPLVIRGINGPGTVTFEIWGVDDGRTVELSQPRIEDQVAPSFMYVEYTDQLPDGRRDHVNDVYQHFDAYVTRTVRNAAGEVTIEETYHSGYRMLPEYVRAGRGPGDPASGKIVKVPVTPTLTPIVSTATGQR
jgi:vancomycin resistance protein YoaR